MRQPSADKSSARTWPWTTAGVPGLFRSPSAVRARARLSHAGTKSVQLAASPLAPGPVQIAVDDEGNGSPVVVLHGGWGYGAYPFGAACDRLRHEHRVVFIERSGYGRSTAIASLPADFHARAASETAAVLDALGIERAALWGHSDGAVIAAHLALAAPDRVAAVVLEAMHLDGTKPSSRDFFIAAAERPIETAGRLGPALEREHGARWPDVVSRHARAWLAIAAAGTRDLYGGRLGALAPPTLVVHGARDPRTEPGELDAIRTALPGASLLVLPEAGHSPHSERATSDVVARAAEQFLAS